MSSCGSPVSNGTNRVAMESICCAVTEHSAETPQPRLIRHCPSCGEKGIGVDTLTVKAMLAISLHAIREGGYGFCRTENCPVVYLALDLARGGEQTFTESDLRVRVHQKHPDDDDVYVCYCFQHTPGSIRSQLVETGQSTVIETVTHGTQVGECACEIRNPQGSCCLGNVRKVVKRARQHIDSYDR